MDKTDDGFTTGGIMMTERDTRYVILSEAICDYFDSLRDKQQGREFGYKETKEFIAATCIRVLNGI